MISAQIMRNNQDYGTHVFSSVEAMNQFCGDEYEAKVVPGTRKHWHCNAKEVLEANKEYQLKAAKKFLSSKK